MDTHLEIEFKSLVTQDELYQIINHFAISEDQFFIQENIYFDTKDQQLQEKLLALRIRKKGASHKLTLKEGGDKRNLETSQPLTKEEAHQIEAKGLLPEGCVKQRLRELGIQDTLHEVTRIVTKRAVIDFHEQKLFFDISSYEGITDYEIELETEEYTKGKNVFLAILNKLNITYRPSEPKIYRALQQKHNNK